MKRRHKIDYMKIFILISRETGQGREEVERRGSRKTITMIIILLSFGKMPLMVEGEPKYNHNSHHSLCLEFWQHAFNGDYCAGEPGG